MENINLKQNIDYLLMVEKKQGLNKKKMKRCVLIINIVDGVNEIIEYYNSKRK